MRGRAENFVKDGIMQSTFREMQAFLRLRNLWITFAAVVLLFTVTGPFGTYEHLRALPRFAYWFTVHALAWPTAIAFSIAGNRLLERLTPYMFMRMMTGAAVAALPIAALVKLIDYAWFATPPTLAGVAGGVLSSLPLCLIFCVISYMTLANGKAAADFERPQPAAVDSQPPGARLLARLKPQNRGTLLHLSVQDHYTHVRTSRGSELILLRFSDALREIDGVDGLQVHRSHWVATAFVSRLERGDGKLTAILEDGTEIPVSRTYAAQARARFG